jgi:CheY-like chemotaxis protein
MKSTSLPPLPANVLLAEDDPDNRIIISTWLRRMGANVDVAENGRVALDTALAALTEDAPYDLVLMDMQMPELDGYGATFQLRSCGYRGLVVAFTAHAMDRDRAQCLALGCDDYLSKPIDRRRLREVVEKALAVREAAAVLTERALMVANAIATGDVTLASRLLHQLRGSAGSHGFATVSDAAEKVETAIEASAGDDVVRMLVAELQSVCRPRAA